MTEPSFERLTTGVLLDLGTGELTVKTSCHEESLPARVDAVRADIGGAVVDADDSLLSVRLDSVAELRVEERGARTVAVLGPPG
jgi:hypothetical protein